MYTTLFSIITLLLIIRMVDFRQNMISLGTECDKNRILAGGKNVESFTQNIPYLTDNTVNTKLTSNDDSIISESNLMHDPLNPKLLSAKYPSIEEKEERKFDINNPKLLNMPNDVCLKQKGRNAVDEVYGNPPKHRGTNIEDVIHMYDRMQGSVDLEMANVMSATSKLAKNSFTNRSRFNKRAFSKYFVEELNFTANKGGWWDNSEYSMYE